MTKQKTRYVIRKGSLKIGENLYLQPFGHWGKYETAKRFSDQTKASAHAEKSGIGDNYGIFPAGPRKPIEWGRDIQREAHKMGWDIFINDDAKFYLQALDDVEGVIAEQAEADGLDPDTVQYTGQNFFDRTLGQYADDNAMNYVIENAKAGNAVCQRAIEFLLDRKSPNATFHKLAEVLSW